jgi:protein phosphatase 1 regulatory subunit 7
MSFVVKDGFLFYDWQDTCIVVEDYRMNEYVDYINKNDLKFIGINDLHYKIDNINFLEKCPRVEKVAIISPLIRNFTGLLKLKTLLELTIREHEGGELDLSKLHNLEFFMGDYNKFLKGLEKATSLKKLSLTKYNPKNKNLQEFIKLSNLDFLQIVQTQISSLKGISNLKNLKQLEIIMAPKLENIDEIEEISESLKVLRFENCKNIKNFSYVKCLKNLESLAFSKCGEIPSIDFIREMPNLKRFIFVDTNIVDGDLSPLIRLEYSGFLDKKHYSHKFKELNDKKYW